MLLMRVNSYAFSHYQPPTRPVKHKSLHIIQATEHNLKGVSLDIPHDAFTVVTGISGSGKSSLAFDTVYAEGQRRYIETFSPYTRQFFDKVKRPAVERIDNVRPAIAIEQRTRVLSSRSTVGSMTNINDYLKILWGAVAEPVCPNCEIAFTRWTPTRLTEHVLELQKLRQSPTLLIGARVSFTPKTRELEIERLKTLGFGRYFDDTTGAIELLEETPPERLRHISELVIIVDRMKSGSLNSKRLRESVEQCFTLSGGSCTVIDVTPRGFRPFIRGSTFGPPTRTPGERHFHADYHSSFVCPGGHVAIGTPKPSLFSFNHPLGACAECKGFGHVLRVDRKRCVPNPLLSIEEDALDCWAGKAGRVERRRLLGFCRTHGIPIDRPWRTLTPEQHDQIFTHTSREYRGVEPWFKRLERKAYKMHVRVFLAKYRGQFLCPECAGTRLKREGLTYRINGRTLPDIWRMPVGELLTWMRDLEETLRRRRRYPNEVRDVLAAVIARLDYLVSLGLPYITLDRQSRTLSGGETQRVNLTTALGSDLISTHFVLDEPSVGLHARDTERLIEAMIRLQRRGNSLLVVEHDLDCIESADHIIEMGPAAGQQGGEVTFNGSAALWPGISWKLPRPAPFMATDRALTIARATVRNLKNISVTVPLDAFVCLTGVSGSGKSTLVHEVVMAAYERFQRGEPSAEGENAVSGFEHLDEILLVDQSPLTKSPRANIATYTGIWDTIRELLAASDGATMRAFTKSTFSFNVDAGRCAACKGAGHIREDMQFLSDVYIVCEVCQGKRFQLPVLEVTYRGKNADDFLGMSVDECHRFFPEDSTVARAAHNLSRLGLGHLTLGHSLSELSGGEAQRLKIVPYLEHGRRGRNLFIFDEPTTGLHVRDVERLIELFHFLRTAGHAVLCIEHNLLLIGAADWIIDLGPEGGAGGGAVLLAGPPADFQTAAASRTSYTARALREFLATSKRTAQPQTPRPAVPSPSHLSIRGAREHNLKNVSLDIPLDQVVVFTGVSGSGKSSIAKDIIYAEGQRRYLDCLSPYARQYIKELKRPEIDSLTNIAPTICVYQHTFQPSRLSTVATMSEIYNFLRLLYAKTATQYCPDHPTERIAALAPLEISHLLKKIVAKSVRIFAPIIKGKKGNHKAVLQRAIDAEISHVRVDGVLFKTSSLNIGAGLEKSKPHTIEYLVAQFNPNQVTPDFIVAGVEQALSLGSGTLIVSADGADSVYSTERTCPVCQRGFFKPDPEDLSFNSPRGRCPRCEGTGKGRGDAVCTECGGARIQTLGRHLQLCGRNIYAASQLTPNGLRSFLEALDFSPRERTIALPIISELDSKIETLEALGLGEITLERECTTLSGGELQRLRLGTAMGSPLTGVIYIFDEPSVGLHPLDNVKVLSRLRALRDRGNAVIMIEHDGDAIRSADYVIDVGPGGGKNGGEIVFAGPRDGFLLSDASVTAQALRSEGNTPAPRESTRSGAALQIHGGSKHNIANLALSLPLQQLVVVAGVSGAGKSSFVHGIIADTLTLGDEEKSRWTRGDTVITSSLEIARILQVDQKPIGINSRSTPASYLGIWDTIRSVFAGTIEAKARGWGTGFFSYNTGKGRCTECKGQGQLKVEMNFLADAWVECEACRGRRFNDEAETVRFADLTISDVLALTFEEARAKFTHHRKIIEPIRQAVELGLGYLTLGQSSPTLSGGESQRLKLVAELSAERRGHTIYILDEPTTGLHKADVEKLVRTLRALVERGHTVLVIEHDADMIRAADHIIEFGPGAGAHGGQVVFSGSPLELALAATPWGTLLRGEKAGSPAAPSKRATAMRKRAPQRPRGTTSAGSK